VTFPKILPQRASLLSAVEVARSFGVRNAKQEVGGVTSKLIALDARRAARFQAARVRVSNAGVTNSSSTRGRGLYAHQRSARATPSRNTAMASLASQSDRLLPAVLERKGRYGSSCPDNLSGPTALSGCQLAPQDSAPRASKKLALWLAVYTGGRATVFSAVSHSGFAVCAFSWGGGWYANACRIPT
jgi:hypothetical protein